MARFQAKDTASAKAFQEAAGEAECTTDAGKVHTREEGMNDLKIAVISKREAGEPTTPEPWTQQRLSADTVVQVFATIATATEFRKPWRPRLRRLSVTSLSRVQALADGASWIWKAVQRVLTGCVQTLDVFHACQHLHQGAERIHGEDQSGAGVCQWVADLLSVDVDQERERRRQATNRVIGYFAKQVNRLNYAERLQAGRAIGSGQVEG